MTAPQMTPMVATCVGLWVLQHVKTLLNGGKRRGRREGEGEGRREGKGEGEGEGKGRREGKGKVRIVELGPGRGEVGRGIVNVNDTIDGPIEDWKSKRHKRLSRYIQRCSTNPSHYSRRNML